MPPDQLKLYYDLLLKWQKAINLIGPSTVPDAWERHFEDSIQIERFIPDTAKTLYDLGSGGGFPGLVLAIQKPALDVTLLEADHKKCVFLSTVSHETKVPVKICAKRIEDAIRTLPAPDIITARALAPLSQLCAMIWPWARANSALIAIFLKGAQANSEITEARRNWSFDIDKHASQTDPTASILIIKNLDRLSDSQA